MGFKNNSKEKVDKNFALAVNILNKNKIKYWICHGTLLGIIRDNQLIPWDHDIDIAVWNSDNLKNKIKKIMLSKKFTLKEKYLIEDDLLTFIKPGGREVDINFYKIKKVNDQNLAFINWFVPKNFFFKLIDALSVGKKYQGNFKLFIRSLFFLKSLFKSLKIYLIKRGNFYKSIGYTQPLNLLLHFKVMKFKKLNIKIPKNYKEYLQYVYGDSWKKPKKDYNWIIDSPSTKDLN